MKGWIFGAAMMLATPAMAEQRYVTTLFDMTQGGLVAVDIDSIREVAGMKRAWVLTVSDRRPEAPVFYSMALAEFDCSAERARTLANQGYQSDGTMKDGMETKGWSYPVPQTAYYGALALACGKKVPTEDEIINMNTATMVKGFSLAMDGHRKAQK